MEIDLLLVNVERKARLHGRREAVRVVTGVVGALADVLPPRASELLDPHLPAFARSSGRVRVETPATVHAFLNRITAILYADQPDNAFLARVVLEELNTSLRVITPAAFAHLVAPDLRPLLSSGRPAIARPTPVAAAAPLAAAAAAPASVAAVPLAAQIRIPAPRTQLA